MSTVYTSCYTGSEAFAGEDDLRRTPLAAGVRGLSASTRETQRHRAGQGQRRAQLVEGSAEDEKFAGGAEEDARQGQRSAQVRIQSSETLTL